MYDHHEKYPDYEKTKKKYFEDKKEVKDREYLDIWKSNPSFRDISNQYSLGKAIFLMFITLFIVLTMYMMSQQLILSVGIGILFCASFLFIFHDEVYLLRYSFAFITRDRTVFNPFEDFVFWHTKDDLATLYISNRKDLVHIALRIYQIKVIAENVQPALHQFVKAFASTKSSISYSYQIVQKPVVTFFSDQKDRHHTLQSLHSRGATINFSVYAEKKGNITDHSIGYLHHKIIQYSNDLKSNIVSSFHHFQSALLSGNALMNAVRTFYMKDKTPICETSSNKKMALSTRYSFWKFLLCVVVLLYFDYFFILLNFRFIYILGINGGFIIALIVLWWRAIFFQVSKKKLLKDDNIIIANPFDNVIWYRVRGFPYSVFMHVENQLLIGTKMVNLKYVRRRPFCLLGKFIEALNNHKLNFTYTLKNRPINFSEFYHNGLHHLRENPNPHRNPRWYPRDYVDAIQNEQEGDQWLNSRSGMWYTMFTISNHAYRYIEASQLVDSSIFAEVEEELIGQSDNLKGAFKQQFTSFEIEDVRTSVLISGILFSVFKQNLFRVNGTHLNYVMFQGAIMYPLTDIVDVLKKGERTEIAAEFNTPLYLENYITIGHTINTEVLEREVPFGLTRTQLYNLLITNGTPQNRDLIAMKIVSELIKIQVPSIIFDFAGEWSKLISYFETTPFQKDIAYFKYRSSFIVDPIKSDIPYDKHNSEYIEYIYHAFGLALKKDDHTVEMFRQTIQRNPEMDLGSINMSLKNQSEWERSPASDQLLTIFSDFGPNELKFFKKDEVVASDFIASTKTIIIDLSVFNELKKKLFVAFVILSKIIHNVTYQDNYHPKIIYIPYLDNIFDSFFLDRGRTYDKIDMFLERFSVF